MAGHLSHPGLVENGTYRLSPDKPEGADRWYISRKDIEENSPSRRDGIDLKKETYLRKSYCTFLQDLGMRLKVPQVTIATAIIFSHRFFLNQSHAKNDRRIIATVCMFLAGKVEETPRPLKDVILVSYEIIHKKDTAAMQKIKQKEVYEQQKELILTGERVVLATLGFDFNINHPYKPLVEAIKKFKVAQNALAQVAWNFVNDGLRTSLCLQFKPHHIAAGAIFLAAKFLKVKLPSDGEKVWWQEFDVTPRQLEEVSNQMLELYEQNRLPASHGSEVGGSAGGDVSHQAPVKPPTAHKEFVSVKSHTEAGGGSSVQPVIPSSSKSRSNEYGSSEGRGDIADHGQHDGTTTRPSKDPSPYMKDDIAEASTRSELGRGQPEKENQEINNNGERASAEMEGSKNKNAFYKPGSIGQDLEHRDSVGQSPHDSISKIDKDKVKAALEKRRKSRGDVTRKREVVDDDDLIERELEDGIELAAEDEKIKQERKQTEGRDTRGWDADNVEEGEVPLSDSADQFQSPKSRSHKRKAESPDEQGEGKQHHDYTPGYRHDRHDNVGDRSKISRLGYTERDKRHVQENIV